jgi:hypothetical protein
MFYITLVSLFISCTNSKTDTAQSVDFVGGNFQFTNSSVDDQCFDGAFSVVFLPDGTAHDWAYPVEIPDEDALPATYNIQLEEPFSVMEVTVSSGGSNGSFVIGNALQEDVLFDEERYQDCIVDLSIEANITAVDNDNISGQATLQVVEYTGETCPDFAPSPCNILLDFSGARL